MGYRSNVVVIVKGELSTELLEHEDFIQSDATLQDSGWTLYHWSWIKWYDSHPEIKAIENHLYELPDSDYAFLRVGEESGDVDFAGEATVSNEECPFFASYASTIEFGLMAVPDWKNSIDQIVRRANQYKSVADTEIWDYLVAQVENYKNNLKN